MQPYQEADEEIRRRREEPKKALKSAINIGASAIPAFAGAKIASKVLPFLSEYIPQDLAIKGLSKIDSRFGKFINKALGGGYDFDEVKDFIRKKAQEPEDSKEKKESSKEDRNVIQKYSPELYQFIREHVRKGKSPLEAASLAQSDKKFSSVIKKLTQDYRVPFSNLLELVFGEEMERQKSLGNFNKKKRGLVDEEMERFEQGYGQPQQSQQPQQQGGQGQAALMQAINKLQQLRGGAQ